MTKRLNWWDFAHTTEPDIWLLERILHSDNHYDRNQIKAIKLKYQALIAEPTIIEKTMSPEQLFNARNPLWTQGNTIQELYDWYKFRKPLDGYDRVDEIIRVSEKINNAIKEQYKARKDLT
jgi:hypothetical protein